LRNNRRYDINCFQFSKAHRREKYSCLHANSYGPGKALTERLDSNNRPGFYYHQSRILPLCFPHHGRSNLLEDERVGKFDCAYSVPLQERRIQDKNRRCRGNQDCDNRWDRD